MGKLSRSKRDRAALGYDETIRRATGIAVARLHQSGKTDDEIRRANPSRW